MLKGKKSYVVAGATFLYAILGYALGYHDFDSAVQLVLGSSAIAALRAGIKNG